MARAQAAQDLLRQAGAWLMRSFLALPSHASFGVKRRSDLSKIEAPGIRNPRVPCGRSRPPLAPLEPTRGSAGFARWRMPLGGGHPGRCRRVTGAALGREPLARDPAHRRSGAGSLASRVPPTSTPEDRYTGPSALARRTARRPGDRPVPHCRCRLGATRPPRLGGALASHIPIFQNRRSTIKRGAADADRFLCIRRAKLHRPSPYFSTGLLRSGLALTCRQQRR